MSPPETVQVPGHQLLIHILQRNLNTLALEEEHLLINILETYECLHQQMQNMHKQYPHKFQ